MNPTHCDKCRGELPKHEPGYCGGSGYAVTRSGTVLCYPCSNELEREQMAGAQSYVAYLSSDGKTLTTWPGGELARVVATSASRTGFYGSSITYVRAVAPDGSVWYGKGAGRGMILTIRRVKSSRPIAA